MKIDFSERIRELRERNHLTQSEMGRVLGVSKTVVSAYETGQYFPKHEILLKLAKAFNVSMNYLYGIPDPEEKVYYMDAKLDLTNIDAEQLMLLNLVAKQFAKTEKRSGP